MRLAPEQRLAVRRLSRRMGCDTSETVRRLVSVALYAVGMDHSAEGDVIALAVAAVGEEDSATIFNGIAEANADAWGPAADRTRAERDASRSTPSAPVVTEFPSRSA